MQGSGGNGMKSVSGIGPMGSPMGYDGGIPPYPGTPAFQAGQQWNPLMGNLTTNPYINGLLDIVNNTQMQIYGASGSGFPPPMGPGAF